MAKLARIIALLVALILAGTLGFMLVEEWSFLDALYMAIITLTTVGYGEVHSLSDAGRVFVILYLLAGGGVFTFALIQLAEFVVQTQFREWLRSRKMDTTVQSLRDHFIVCGFGRMGKAICRQLAAKGVSFIAVDLNEAAVTECQQEGWPWLVGDATDDQILLAAGVQRARGLAAVLSSDAENLYVVISARLMSKRLHIISRASDEKGLEKLKRVGANRVVNLYAVGAAKVAQFLLSPNVEAFFEVVSSTSKNLDLAEIRVVREAPYADQTLSQADFRDHGIMIVGIRSADGTLLVPPPSSTVIRPGDSLIAFGNATAISTFAGVGEPTARGHQLDELEQIMVRDLMIAEFPTVKHSDTVTEIVRIAKENPRFESLPVMDEAGRLRGFIRPEDLHRLLDSDVTPHLVRADDIALRPPIAVAPDENLLEALRDFGVGDVETLPVEERIGNSRRLVGLLVRSDVMRRYREELLK